MLELKTADGESVTVREALPLDADAVLRYIYSCGGMAHYEDLNGYFRSQWGIKSQYKQRLRGATKSLIDDQLLRTRDISNTDEAGLPHATYIVTGLGEQYLDQSLHSANYLRGSR